MILKKNIILFVLCLCAIGTINAQTDTIKKNPNRLKIIGLPIVLYSPDTKLGGGVGGLLTFNFKSDSIGARRSSVTVGAVYTQLNQLLLYFPFQLFPHNQAYWLSGEISYYRYIYNYFGIGNNVSLDYLEKYEAAYPRIRISAVKKIKPNLYVGLRYAFDDFKFTRVDSGGILEKRQLTGSTGGRVSGIGGQLNFDTRDALFFPHNGSVVEAYLYGEGQVTGSDFSYQRLSVDASSYFSVGKNSVLAINGAAVLSFGDVPFHQMPVIGGTKRLRGYYEGKYRDNNLLVLQSELRFPIYKRFGGVVFGGLGEVTNKLSRLSFENAHYNFGGGLRFTLDKAQHINIRADYGIGYKSSGFYLTIGEAF